jgi:hypothetical protein
MDFVDPSGLQMVAIWSCSLEFGCNLQAAFGFGTWDGFNVKDRRIPGEPAEPDPPTHDSCTLVVYVTAVGSGSSSGSSSSSQGQKPPDGKVGIFNHLYLTYSDSSSGITIGLRGGPDENNNLYASIQSYDAAFKDYENNPQGAVVENYDGNCDAFNRSFNETVNKVNQANIRYSATGNNSNAFLYTALNRAGIEAKSFTKRINGFLGWSGSVPGWGTTIPIP